VSALETITIKAIGTASRILKLFIWKYFNTGLLIIFVNWKITLFGYNSGYWDDFTPSWFSDVGFSIQLSFFAQIFVMMG